MPVTPERRAELKAMIEKAIGGPLPRATRPKVVASKIEDMEGTEEKSEIVRDADVKVSAVDPNHDGDRGEVRVRRNDFVMVRMDLWEEQQRQKRAERRHRRQLDPCRLGHWGPVDDED
jgi:hypothetical protein